MYNRGRSIVVIPLVLVLLGLVPRICVGACADDSANLQVAGITPAVAVAAWPQKL